MKVWEERETFKKKNQNTTQSNLLFSKGESYSLSFLLLVSGQG